MFLGCSHQGTVDAAMSQFTIIQQHSACFEVKVLCQSMDSLQPLPKTMPRSPQGRAALAPEMYVCLSRGSHGQ